MRFTLNKHIKRIISSFLTISIISITSSTAFAHNINGASNCDITLQSEQLQEDNLIIPEEYFDPNHPDAIKDPETIEKFEEMLHNIQKPSNGRVKRSATAGAVIAVYNIPVIGQVALLATGAFLVSGVIYESGSWIYKQATEWLASKNEPADVSWRPGWTEVKDEDSVLGKVNGKKEPGRKGNKNDGTRVHDVTDKKTGEKIGEIHHKQPEEIQGKRTGRKYPDHFQDFKNRLGKGTEHHYWWE